MIFRLVLFAVAATLICVLLKENSRSGALMLSVAGCVGIFIMCTHMISSVSGFFSDIRIPEGVSGESLSAILKTLGIAYLTSFGTDICNDAGEKAVANALEAAGKIIMLSMALPLLGGIFKSVVSIVG